MYVCRLWVGNDWETVMFTTEELQYFPQFFLFHISPHITILFKFASEPLIPLRWVNKDENNHLSTRTYVNVVLKTVISMLCQYVSSHKGNKWGENTHIHNTHKSNMFGSYNTGFQLIMWNVFSKAQIKV